MSTKKYFEKHKQGKHLRGSTQSTLHQFTASVESEQFIQEYTRTQTEFIPDVDYADPKNFVKYGLAKKYYADSLKRIYNQYPYDGSAAEQSKFYNDLTPLEKYIFDNLYPKSTGYARFSPAGWGTATAAGNPATKEYIKFYGGPGKGNVYDTGSVQTDNLKLDYTAGNTVEFWLKKDGWVGSDADNTEVLFDLRTTASYNNVDHRQFQIFLKSNTAAAKKIIYLQDRVNGAAGGLTVLNVELDSGLDDIADSKWHHYAVTIEKNSNNNFITASLYVDKKCQGIATSDTYGIHTTWYNTQKPAIATIGAQAGVTINSGAKGLGWFKLSGSIDEFRFWKSRRTSEHIGRNYFVPIHGGTNTDVEKYFFSSSLEQSPVDLGVYFKFNEGVTGRTETDDNVLDYSGRNANGTWTGYSAYSRDTNSAIVESGVASSEEGDPVIYSYHPDVVTLSNNLEASGSNYDLDNNASLINSIPSWIIEEDDDGELTKLTQIMGSYLDTIYGQIGEISKLKGMEYTTGSAKPFAHSGKLLNSVGFDTPDWFIQANVLEAVFSRDEKRTFSEKIYHLKNLIYKNVYNNLVYIYKSKGTEKAFRNLFRCFGVDTELFKINIYGDNVEYEFENTFEVATAERKAIDFTGIQREADREATIYQYPSSSAAQGYISASWTDGDSDVPFTTEAEVIFPKKIPIGQFAHLGTLTTSSLFGCHSVTASTTDADTTWAALQRDFQVYAIQPEEDRTYFMLTSSAGHFPELTSSNFYDVYDNSKWNFAVRIKPERYPWTSEVTSSQPALPPHSASYEFYGTAWDHGYITEEFSVSSSVSALSASAFITGSNNKFYIGAHRTDFTGSLITKSDVRYLNFRVWKDYLTDEEIQYHAKDTDNYGRMNPAQNTFIFENTASIGGIHIPKIDTLALHWAFFDVTSSDSTGKFIVEDLSSGSADLQNRYLADNFGSIVKANHTGRAEFFDTTSENVYTVEFAPVGRIKHPENLYSTDLVQVVTKDDTFWTKYARPSEHFFSIEASMYDIISKNVFDFFASIDDFNNQIGEPIHEYRDRYKGLEKLRNLFFERVQNTPDVDRFVNLYKWLDAALDSIVVNLMPASANASDKVRSIIEEHALGRSKYRWKYTLLKDVKDKHSISPGRRCKYRCKEPRVSRTTTRPKCKCVPPTYTQKSAGGALQMSVEVTQTTPGYWRCGGQVVTFDVKPGCDEQYWDPVSKNCRKWCWESDEENTTGAPETNAPAGDITVARSTEVYTTDAEIEELRPDDWDGGRDIITKAEYNRATLFYDSAVTNFPTLTRQEPQHLEELGVQLRGNPSFQTYDADVQTYVEYSDASVVNTLGSPDPSDESKSYFWWKNSALRDRGVFAARAKTTITVDSALQGGGLDTFTLIDYEGTSQVYEFDTGATQGSFAAGAIGLVGTGNSSNVERAKSIALGINNSSIKITATPTDGSSATITITQNLAGETGNKVISDGISGATFSGNFTGGLGSGVIKKSAVSMRTQLHLNKAIAEDIESGKPYVFSSRREGSKIFGIRDKNKIWDYYRLKNREAGKYGTNPADGIYVEFNDAKVNADGKPFIGYEPIATTSPDYVIKKVPLRAFDGPDIKKVETGISASIDFYGQERLPFVVHDSSITDGYQANLAGLKYDIAINHLHQDIRGSIYETTLQGPFSEENVGGSMHRHGQLFKTSDLDRKEAFKINILSAGDYPILISNPRVSGTTYNADYPRGDYLRAETAKRPVNIRNIKNITGSVFNYAGNYAKNYEIINLVGRKNNNRFIAKNYIASLGEANIITEQQNSNILWGDTTERVKEFSTVNERRPGGSDNHVIASKFSSRGGPETEGRSMLDIEAEEYSAYNAVPYQGVVVRGALDVLSARHCDQHGYDSFYGDNSGIASFHKVHRNNLRKIKTVCDARFVGNQYDNLFVTHQIPRTDLQYKWIRDAWILNFSGSHFTSSAVSIADPLADEMLPLYGFRYSDYRGHDWKYANASSSISFVMTGAAFNSADGLPYNVDFVGLNSVIAWHIDTDSNQLGPLSTDNNYYGLPLYDANTAPYTLYGLLNNLNGPYGWPTWKQIRTGEHPVARYHKDNNILEAVYNTQKGISKVRLRHAPVTSKHKPIKHVFTDLSNFEYSHGNELHHYGLTYDIEDNQLKDHNKVFNAHVDKQNTLFSELSKANIDTAAVRYSETVWPRDENVNKKVTKTRALFGDYNKVATSESGYYSYYLNSKGTVLGTNVVDDKSKAGFWNDNKFLRIFDGVVNSHGDYEIQSTWPLDVISASYLTADQGSGELWQLDNCHYIKNTLGITCQVPTGSGRDVVRAKLGRNYNKCRPDTYQEHAATARKPFSNYETWANDLSKERQGKSLISEFNISDYVGSIITTSATDNYAYNFLNYKNYTLLGPASGPVTVRTAGGATAAEIADAASEPISDATADSYLPQKFILSDPLTHAKDMSSIYGQPKGVRLTFNGVIKLLPYEGFYPAQRSIQLATMFSDSYASTATVEGAHGTFQTLTNLFYAPGIFYNTIKAGIAQDTYVIDSEVYGGLSAANVSLLTRGDQSGLGANTYKATWKRLPFEALIEPEAYFKRASITDVHDIDYEIWNAASTASLGTTDRNYERAIHNFTAETVNFFLKDSKLTSLKSKPINNWRWNEKAEISSGHHKKYGMSVVVRKNSSTAAGKGFTMCDNPGYFGPWPYRANLPPWESLHNSSGAGLWGDIEGSNNRVCVSPEDGDVFPPANAYGGNSAIMNITFDPTNIANEDPIKYRGGKFTIEDIMANSTVECINENMGGNTDSGSYMALSASIDPWVVSKDPSWVISPKFETPILNFSGSTAYATNPVNGTQQSGNGEYVGDPTRGMWMQHGYRATYDRGLTMQVTEIADSNPNLTGSLVDMCGFDRKKKLLGEIKDEMVLEEAVVAIPYYYAECGKKQFFEIPIEQYESALEIVNETGNERSTTKDSSIVDMIRKLRKYVMNPSWDFQRYRDYQAGPLAKEEYKTSAPFVTVVYEFGTRLDWDDLSAMWQNSAPDIASTRAESQTVTLDIPIATGELFSKEMFDEMGFDGKLPENFQWMIFKIKKRAKSNYFDMFAESTDSVSKIGKPWEQSVSFEQSYSYNWPYDFCSLVEYGEMEVALDYEVSTPEAIAEGQTEKIITIPSETIVLPANLNMELTAAPPSINYFTTKAEAETQAQLIGCRGTHQMLNGRFMPCKSHEEYMSSMLPEQAPQPTPLAAIAFDMDVDIDSPDDDSGGVGGGY